MVEEIQDVIASTSIAVLAYVGLYQQIRECIPRIPYVTLAEIVILLNLAYSLFPLCIAVFEYRISTTASLVIFAIFNAIICGYTIFIWCQQCPYLHNTVPDPIKMRGDKKGVDQFWETPHMRKGTIKAGDTWY